mmetsp:Transcript_6188/g.17756  ORF Transcript_6188/g.17756 Transcript_6188/m.17756 type:complete len:88 (-) Transcript_6188:1484-1747(-)
MQWTDMQTDMQTDRQTDRVSMYVMRAGHMDTGHTGRQSRVPQSVASGGTGTHRQCSSLRMSSTHCSKARAMADESCTRDELPPQQES